MTQVEWVVVIGSCVGIWNWTWIKAVLAPKDLTCQQSKCGAYNKVLSGWIGIEWDPSAFSSFNLTSEGERRWL